MKKDQSAGEVQPTGSFGIMIEIHHNNHNTITIKKSYRMEKLAIIVILNDTGLMSFFPPLAAFS